MVEKMKELFEQIEISMKKQPDLSLVELIEYVMKFKYPSKNLSTNYFYINSNNIYVCQSDLINKWRPSNEDILKAFKTYNKIK